MPDTIPIQFKVGKQLVELVDEAVLHSDHNYRNQWMLAAVNQFLTDGYSLPYPITMDMLWHQRKIVMVRLPILTLEMVNEVCDERPTDRNRWLTDAMLSMLARSGVGLTDLGYQFLGT